MSRVENYDTPVRGDLAGNFVRGCSTCGAFLVTNDAASVDVYCDRHRPAPFMEWLAKVGAGCRVYLQPSVAWRGLSHSEYLVIERHGDDLTVQITGMPESRTQVNVAHCGQRDLTPLPWRGAPW